LQTTQGLHKKNLPDVFDQVRAKEALKGQSNKGEEGRGTGSTPVLGGNAEDAEVKEQFVRGKTPAREKKKKPEERGLADEGHGPRK